MAVNRWGASLRAAACGLIVLVGGAAAHAQSTWDGGGANNNLNTAANWADNLAPAAGSNLVFDGSMRLTPNNTVNDFVVKGVSFGSNAGSFALNGERMVLGIEATAEARTGGVTNNDDSLQTIGNALALARGQHQFATTSSGSLALNGTITRGASATARFAPLAGTDIKTTLTNTTAGLIGGWATIQNPNPARIEETFLYAKVDGSGNVVPYLDYTADTDIEQGETFPVGTTADSNLRWRGTAAAGGTLAAPAGTTNLNTFLFEQDLMQILAIGANNTLRFADGGGIFRASAAGANAEHLRLTGGTVTAGNSSAPATLQLWTNTPVDPVTTVGEHFNNQIHFQSTAITNNPQGGVVTVIKNGPGGVRITAGGQTFSGGLYVNRGVWRTESNPATALGSGPVFVASGAQIYLQGAGVYPNNINIAGFGVVEGTNFQAGVLRGVGTGVQLNGTITLTAAARISQRGSQTVAAIPATNPGFTINGKITGDFPLELSMRNDQGNAAIEANMPTMILTNSSNDWSGDTTIGNGRVRVGGAGEVIPHGPGKGNLILMGEGVAGRATVLTVDGRIETVNGLISTGAEIETYVTNQIAADGVLRVGANNATSTFGGVVTDTATFGKMHLTKIGSGIASFTGFNAYTGSTRVEGGTLRFTQASLAATSHVFLTTGAALNLDTSGAVNTIDSLWIDGVQQLAGEYGAVGSGAPKPIAQITGSGRLMVQDLALPGDFDGSHVVNGDDLTVWKTAMGKTALGDADYDGDSDGQDFLIWQRQLGKSKGLVAPVSGAVPEPSGAMLACAAAMGLAARGRGRVSRET